MVELKTQINYNSLIIGDRNTKFSQQNKTKQAIWTNNKQRNIRTNITKYQMDLTEMYRIFNLNTKEYTFCLAAHEVFFKVDSYWDIKQILN